MELREICDVEIGSFINLRSTKGDIISLRVSDAYKEDVKNDSLAGYVTRNVFDGLLLKEEKVKCEQQIDVYNGITLGCDPELFLIEANTGKLLNAGKLFIKYGQVGSDGMLLEIRPLPSTSELVVTNNIYNCLCRARAMVDSRKGIDGKNIKMIAASYYGKVSAGFHLHFGIPEELRSGGRGSKEWCIRTQIARVLDYYVGIPAIIPEGEADVTRRSADYIQYGKPGEWRQEGITFEYRVAGGYLLRHPILTMGILGLGAIVMEDAMSRFRACTDNFHNLDVVKDYRDTREIYTNVPDIFSLSQIICSTSIKPARKELDIITNDLMKMVGFSKRRKSIEGMFRSFYNGEEYTDAIEENWRSFYHERQQKSLGFSEA